MSLDSTAGGGSLRGEPQPPAGRTLGTVLLVEDQPDNQKLLSLFLRRGGFEVAVAGNGMEAIAEAGREPVDLVLMDVQMPIMDGLTATRALRKAGFAKPILALTAHAMSEDRSRCLAAGCNGYLAKPITSEALLGAVRRWLGLAGEERPERLKSRLVAEDPDFAPLVAEYVASLPDQLAGLQEALAKGDLAETAALAHRLKGSGGSFGFPLLSEIAATMEQAARGGDGPAAAAALALLEEALPRIEVGVPA